MGGAQRQREDFVPVTIVADNPETIDGLEVYLRRAGVVARGTRRLGECTTNATGLAALVLFPDDFDHRDVIDALERVRTKQPNVLTILVTSEPKRFEPKQPGGSLLVIPRPAWGWTILDAIRGYAPLPERERGR